jgi:hypothetical protein
MCLRSGGSARSFSKNEAREMGANIIYWYRAYRNYVVSGSGEGIGKFGLFMGKGFHRGVVGEGFCGGWSRENGRGWMV